MNKTFTFELSPVSVGVEVAEGVSDKDALKLAEQELVKQLSKKFPFYKYNVVTGNVINDADVVAGRPVKFKDTGEIGIIYEVKPTNKFPIKIVKENGLTIQCKNSVIEKVSKRTNVEKLIKGRDSLHKTINEWDTGCTGFFVNGEEIIPVIIDASGRSKIKAIIVGHEAKGSYYTLNAQNLQRLFDSLSEAEEFQGKYLKK